MDQDDKNLLIFLSGDLSTTAAKDNWVDHTGKLPAYITKIAKGIKKSGKSTSEAIPIAISQIKRWAAGGADVDAGTKAKAAKAVAEWTALKAKNKARKLVKASHTDGSEYVMLSVMGPYNTEHVRIAWNSLENARRSAIRAQNKMQTQNYPDTPYESVPYSYIKELWTDHILVEAEGSEYGQKASRLQSIPYWVADDVVIFGEPVTVKVSYIEIEDEDLNEYEIALLKDYISVSI